MDLGKRFASLASRAIDGATLTMSRGGIDTGLACGAPDELIARHTIDSPHLQNGAFANVEPSAPPIDRATVGETLRERKRGKPACDIPVHTPSFPTPASCAVTWLGHASAVIELDGRRILTDPVLSQRCSPSQLVGPLRMHRAPCGVDELPHIDVVLISHDHYDHLDMQTVVALGLRQPGVTFVAPLGVGAHLQFWGIDSGRIIEADWGDDVTVGDLRFSCVRARHFSGRRLTRNRSLWASWGIRGPQRSAFFTGDTGFTASYAGTGTYDLTLVPIGAYNPAWPDIHVDPEEGGRIHQMLAHDRSVMLPIHWGTFNLATHPWGEPMNRLSEFSTAQGISVITPMPGERVDIDDRGNQRDWWRGIV